MVRGRKTAKRTVEDFVSIQRKTLEPASLFSLVSILIIDIYIVPEPV